MRYNLLRVLIFMAGHIAGGSLLAACPEKQDSKPVVQEVEMSPLPSPTITISPSPAKSPNDSES